jgi:hypothetical protein
MIANKAFSNSNLSLSKVGQYYVYSFHSRKEALPNLRQDKWDNKHDPRTSNFSSLQPTSPIHHEHSICFAKEGYN